MVKPVLGEMLTPDTTGFRLLRVLEALKVSEPPLGSVTVAVQTMLSPTLAVLLVKVRLEPVPSVEDPFVHT